MAQRQFRSDDTSKWNEGFGNGIDGDLVISSNVTDTPIDGSCSGTEGQFTLSATNVNFVPGQCLLIHQTRGTGVGSWELNKIISYSAGTINLKYPLTNTYTDSGASQAQVLVLRQYRSVTINSTKILTAKAWDQNVGGILSFLCNGIVTINGTILGNGLGGSRNATQHGYGEHALGGHGVGFWGGDGYVQFRTLGVGAWQGESELKVGLYAQLLGAANGGAGGGPRSGGNSGDSLNGGGASYATEGSQGPTGLPDNNYNGQKGSIHGIANLTSLRLGDGGGGSWHRDNYAAGGGGGGGIILIISKEINCSNGIISVIGGNGTVGNDDYSGGGSGGSILLKTEIATLGTSKVLATGGAGTSSYGGVGRIHLDYRISISGTTNPAIDLRQDYSIKSNVGGAILFGQDL